MDDAHLPEDFGRVVRELRTAKGLSQERFAHASGIDRAYMGTIERGTTNPTLTMMARVAEALDMPLSAILKKVEKLNSQA